MVFILQILTFEGIIVDKVVESGEKWLSHPKLQPELEVNKKCS